MLTNIQKQIEYAETKPWFPAYISNLKRAKETDTINNFQTTIVNLFVWQKTPEGEEFWSKIDDELSHYSSELLIDNILEKYPKEKYPEYYL